MPEDIPEPAQEGAVEVTYETLGDLVQRFHDHTEAILVHRIQVIGGVQREQGQSSWEALGLVLSVKYLPKAKDLLFTNNGLYIMEDEHLETYQETESEEIIKSSVRTMSQPQVSSDGISEGECDFCLVCDDSSPEKGRGVRLISFQFAKNFNLLLSGVRTSELALLVSNSTRNSLNTDSKRSSTSINDYSSMDDDSYKGYQLCRGNHLQILRASQLEVVEIVIPEVGRVIDTLLPFSSENEDKVVNTGILGCSL
ncbi:hypothetical protein Tco_1402157 [Tanacetum coccineum]